MSGAGARDRRLLYAAAFLRALATSASGVLLGIYLAALDLPPGQVGLVLGAGLAGATATAFLATVGADRTGRRRALIALALLGGAGGLALALASSPAALGVAAFAGMANAMGRDRGASLIVEQAILPATTSDEGRTRAFAWYNVLQDAGHALGALAAGLPALLREAAALGAVGSLRAMLAGAALLVLATAPLYLGLGPSAGRPRAGPGGAPAGAPVSPGTRRILLRISALFALDGLGGGFLSTALLALFFRERFGAGEGAIGLLFAGARVLNAFSHLGAAWLARRIGLVETMVFTHIPSSLLLVTAVLAPSFPVAAALFLLREGLVEMDVPTRQSYVMAVVRPDERVFASGVTHIVRLAAWAVAPTVAGFLMGGLAAAAPFVVGAALKVAYDVLLYAAFRRVRPPEETEAASERPAGLR